MQSVGGWVRRIGLGSGLGLLAMLSPTLADESGTIEVEGSASVERKADYFTVLGFVSERSKDRETALKAMAMKVEAVQDTLTRLEGLEGLAIETTDGETRIIRPDGCKIQDYRERPYPDDCAPIDFISSVSMTIRARPITQTGALLSILSELDVEEAELLGFRVDDPLAAQNEARRQAVANAKKVARIIADEAGSVLGAPVKITYGRDSRRYRSLRFADEDRPAPLMAARQPVRPKVEVNLAQGRVTFREDVTIIFALEPAREE